MRWNMFRLGRVDAVRVAHRAVRARNLGFHSTTHTRTNTRSPACTRARTSTKPAGFTESRLTRIEDTPSFPHTQQSSRHLSQSRGGTPRETRRALVARALASIALLGHHRRREEPERPAVNAKNAKRLPLSVLNVPPGFPDSQRRRLGAPNF